MVFPVLKGNRDERETVDISLAKQDAQVAQVFFTVFY